MIRTPPDTLKGLIWDLDNTLYRIHQLASDAFDQASARAALELGVDLDLEEARVLARKSFETLGFSGQIFINEFGISWHDLHFAYHRHIDVSILEKCTETCDLFAALPHEHVLVTHASRDWAHTTLAHLGLDMHFPADRILALEDYGFEKKYLSARSFKMALEKLGTTPAETAVVEDIAKNLKIPCHMGLYTILIHHGREPDPLPDYVRATFADTPSLLRSLGRTLQKTA